MCSYHERRNVCALLQGETNTKNKNMGQQQKKTLTCFIAKAWSHNYIRIVVHKLQFHVSINMS